MTVQAFAKRTGPGLPLTLEATTVSSIDPGRDPFDDVFPADDVALEPYCTACGAAVAIFAWLGGDWQHYAGDPVRAADVWPYRTDHEPVTGWRPATGPVAIVAL
jgi:hypothetical protein